MAHNLEATFSPSTSGNITEASDRILRSTIQTLIALRLDEIDERWVQEIWESQVPYFEFENLQKLIWSKVSEFIYFCCRFSLQNATILTTILKPSIHRQ